MYNGYDISPRNLQTRVVTLSVVFPEAPRQTNKGNATAKHIVSYKPFIHRCSLPPILGIADKMTIEKLPIQNAPRTLTGLKMRDNNKPAGNENNNRKEPPIIFSSVKAKPTHISPSGPQRANTASPHPADNTNTERTFVESLCRKNAYRILPIYSKNRDQLGPFRGYISPTPRISIPGVAGIRKAFISVAYQRHCRYL